MMCNVTAAWRAHRRGALFANPCYTQIHPTCIPSSDEFQSKLTLMSESLRNDGRIWVPEGFDETRRAADIPEAERDYYLERKYPGLRRCHRPPRQRRHRREVRQLVRHVRAHHRRRSVQQPHAHLPRHPLHDGWPVAGLFCIGEANFSDHGANRLGASALMQGLADGYFVLPYTVGNYLADQLGDDPMSATDPAFGAVEAEVHDTTNRWLATQGTKSVDYYHRELGKLVWNYIGMERDKNGLEKAISEIPALKAEYYKNVRVLGSGNSLNQSLEKAGRVADFFELAELKARDALAREESCGGHFRTEHMDEEGEAARDDENFQHVAAWEWTGEGSVQNRHQEELEFNYVKPSKRSYK